MTIEKLIVNLSGHNYQDSVLKNIDHLEMLKHVTEEIGIARVKCLKIKKINGCPVKIKELELTGKHEIEQIKIGYISNGKMKYNNYTIDEFYSLK